MTARLFTLSRRRRNRLWVGCREILSFFFLLFLFFLDMSPESNSSHAVLGDDGYELDGVCVDANFQCIRFQPFQQTQWHVLCDQNLKEL